MKKIGSWSGTSSSANVNFISWGPSLLWDNRALSGPNVEVQQYPRMLGRDPWQLWQHMVLLGVPRPTGVYYIVVLIEENPAF